MVTVRVDGRVEFRFLAPRARRVQIAGEFTDWLRNPIEMKPHENGWWSISIRLPLGEHRFRYLVDGQWRTDFAAFGVAPNEFGQFDSMLFVDAPALAPALPIAAA